MAKEDKKVIEKMLKHFRLSAEAESKNRESGLEALKFRSGGEHQWDGKILQNRQSDNRPSETYNQIPQFVHQVTNDMRMNMPQVKFMPGRDGTKEVAEAYEDLTRNICTSSEAEVAFDTAADSQVTIGWGYVRVLTDYENDKTFDQIIKIGWVPNPFCVYDDPHCMMQDRSDRKFAFIVSDMPRDEFNYENDKNYGNNELSSIGDKAPAWATNDTVRVAEYWSDEGKNSKLYRRKGSNEIIDTLPEGANLEDYDTRNVYIPKIVWRKCTALEVLEKKEWPGKYIPLVFVSGEELNIDGKKELSGIVRYMMAPQKQYNYWTNYATESADLAFRQPYIADPKQIEGYEKFWDQANVKKFPYLPARFVVDNNVVGAPQRANNSVDMSAAMNLVQAAQQNLYTTSGIYPASLGRQGNEVSGKAIMARQREGDVSTFHFSDNLARAWRFLGRILQDLFPIIYDSPRDVTLTKEDKTSKLVRINEPFEDERGERQHFDFTTGTYDIAITTGPSFTTKRQEAAESMTQIIQAAPNLMGIAGDLLVGNMDWPGADKLAERIKKTLPPGLADEPKKGEIPPQVQQAMQAMQEQITQLTQIAQQQAQELESKQADIANKQADIQLKQQNLAYSAQSDEIKLRIEAQKMDIDRLNVEIKQGELAIKQKQVEIDAIKAETEAFKAHAEAEAKSQEIELEAYRIQLDGLNRGNEQEAPENKENEANVESGMTVAIQGLGAILQKMNEPKSIQVIRNPQGLIEGAVSE